MPSKSAKQRKFMAAAANNPDFARRAGIPQSVAREYHEADKMYEGGLAPMNRVEEGKGGLGGLGAMAQNFRKGGLTKAERRARREAEGYEEAARYRKNLRYGPHKTRYKGVGAPLPRVVHGLGRSSRKHKGWMVTNPQPQTGQERRLRRRAQRWQERGKWGDEPLTKIKNPTQRRNLIRAGWVPVRNPSRKRKGKTNKKYKYGTDERTVFYPPGQTSVGASGQYTRRLRNLTPGAAYSPTQGNIMASYIAPGSAEGGPVNMFYGGPLRRQLKRMEEEKKRREEMGEDWEDWMAYGTGPVKYKDIGGKGIKKMFSYLRMKQLGWQPSFLPKGGKEGQYTDKELKDLVLFPPGSVSAGPPTTYGDDDGGFTEGGIDPTAGQGGGPRGRRGRGRRGGRGRRYTPPEPRDIPGSATPPGRTDDGGLVPPAQPPIDYTPPDPRAGRDTPYSQALRAHRARMAATLGVPAGGFAGGGEVSNAIPASRERGYAEGGTAREDNPYERGSARWKLWERKHGRDPSAPDEAYQEPEPEEIPPAKAAEDDEEGIFSRLFGRSEEELEKIEERYRGGYIPASREVGYQMGGPATIEDLRTAAALRPPMGGVPPRVEMQEGGRARGIRGFLDRAQRRRPPGSGQVIGRGQDLSHLSPRLQRLVRRHWRNLDRQGYRPSGRDRMQGRQIPGSGRMTSEPIEPTGALGRFARGRGAMPGDIRPRMPIKGGPRMMVPPSAPPGDMPAGPMGGPRVPPNLRGMLQRRMMENRPRRGIPGPAGAGGAPNRVGQGDQMGGLSRALQRGTGRPPMSRRQGFYR